MNIAIASGKGGTGKTTLAVNLFAALSLKENEGAVETGNRKIQDTEEGEGNVRFIDCDVEEPNSAHFLKVNFSESGNEIISQPHPVFNEDKCTHCKRCAEFCQYNAIAVLPEKVMFFPELCNGCAGCKLVCPADAINENERNIGKLRSGTTVFGKDLNKTDFYEGQLNPGEAKAVPVIHELLEKANADINILDSPPGTSCPVVETVREADYCILVTEPTPFGLHDLKLALNAIRDLDVPMGVVINRQGVGDSKTEEFCRDNNIEILMRIPFQKKIAELYSVGTPFVEHMPEMRQRLQKMFEKIRKNVFEAGEVKI